MYHLIRKRKTLSKILVHDSARNKLIISDITAELKKGKKIVVITERTDHIVVLYQFLKQSYEAITLSGEDSEKSRTSKYKLLKEGQYQVLITTGQYFGEGTDLQNATCLFLVYPFSFKGKLIQYIGRVQRSAVAPVIYDYRDHRIDYLNRLFLQRNKHYRHFDRQATLFDEYEQSGNSSEINTIDKNIKVEIDKLDFRYGSVVFNYENPEVNISLEFEVENDFMRPEFDVLKPYFAKVLKNKYITARIYAEFENNVLVSQSASSLDIESINQEIIETVRFRFVKQDIIGRRYSQDTGQDLLKLNDVQETSQGQSLFKNEEELLNDILMNKQAKHYRHLKFLAMKHENNIMKLRFVLNPFSFFFLLSGREQYHLILETLDTEEATYLWHIDKSLQNLKDKIALIEQDLQIIRNKGRQYFLDNQPDNFSRILHDYSDERKGFILWKDSLEEILM